MSSKNAGSGGGGWTDVTRVRSKPRPKRKPKKIAKPIEISDYDWDHCFDPIDKELYDVLEQSFPEAITFETMLERLIAMDPSENADYMINNVWDSFDISLKDYVYKQGIRYGGLRDATE